MNWRLINSIITTTLSAFVVFLLVSSFGMHSLQISHMHPGHENHHETSHQGEQESHGFVGLGEYMHAAEKKLFLLVASALLVNAAVPFLVNQWTHFVFIVNSLFLLLLSRRRVLILQVNNYLKLSLALGILNPKLY